MQPWWLLLLSSAALTVALASSAAIVVDTYLRGYRQAVKIMDVVWPVTALYFGPAAVAAYWLWGRPQAPRWRQRHGNPPKRRRRADFLTELCHGGTHCTLGVIIGEVAIFATGVTLGGKTLWAGYLGDYLIAVALSFAFRYSISAYRGGRRIGTTLAGLAKAGLLTISAFESVLFACLALIDYVIFPGPMLRPNSPTFWFFVQIGLVGGYFVTWPVTVWLTHLGVKIEPPDTLH